MNDAGTILDVGPAPPAGDHDLLEAFGHRVALCDGPGDGRRCPLVEEGACPLVDGADGVVFRLDLDDDYHREMLRCYRRALGDSAPLHVVVGEGQQDRHARLLHGLPVSVGALGPRAGDLSAQVSMAAAAREILAEMAGSSHRSAHRSLRR